jgi:hypothetical protein
MAITALANISANFVDITTIPTGALSGVVLTNGTAPLTANWNAGNFSIASQNSTDWQDIVAWGADPTGAVSSVTAINNAIAALSANGGVIYAPTGTYLIDATITISKNGVTIIGAGYFNAAASFITRFQKKSTLAGPVFSVQASGVSLRDFYVDGNTGGGATGDGVLIVGTSQLFTASRVTVSNNSANGWNMGNNTLAVTDDFKFDSCVSSSNGANGWALNSTTPDTNGGTFINCHALNNTGDGYQLLHCQFNAFFGGSAQSNGANGAHFMVGSAQNSIFGGDYELNVNKDILIDASATTVSIFGILSSKIVNNSTSTFGTNIYGPDQVLVSGSGATGIHQNPATTGAFWDNYGVGLSTNFRSSNATAVDTTWGIATGAGAFTFQKTLTAGSTFSTAESQKTLANGANQDVVVTTAFVEVLGPTLAFSIGGVVPAASQAAGQIVTFWNATGSAMTVNSNDAGSGANNRIRNSTGANVACGGTAFAWFTIQYSAFNLNWNLLGHS